MADRRRWWTVGAVAAAILIGTVAFYVFVVNAPINFGPPGPIPSLQP